MYHKLNTLSRLVFLSLVLSLSTGCTASLFGSPMHNVRIQSEPQDANFTITDESGELVAQGTTPDSVLLRTSSSFFRKARYYVTFDTQGYQTQTQKLKARLSPWYLVDVLVYIPGIIGALIIDPFTGAMFTLPDESSVILEPAE